MFDAFATIMFISSRLDSRALRESVRLTGDQSTDGQKEWAKRVEKSYSSMKKFYYNDFYQRHLRYDHIGCESVPHTVLGDLWLDYVLAENRSNQTVALHIHIRFPRFEHSFAQDHDRLTAMISFLRDILWSIDSQIYPYPRLEELGRQLLDPPRPRKTSFNTSRYSYVSIVRTVSGASEQGRATERNAELANVYRLLFLTANPISAERASRYLSKHTWSSEDFFELYDQPGGLVSVAEPYPADMQAQHRDWFMPTPPDTKAVSPGASVAKDVSHSWNYDHLPEYPPLRYLALPSLEFAAGTEEVLRDVQNDIFATMARGSRRSLFRALLDPVYMWWSFSLPNELVRYFERIHRAENVEAVRLPVARQLVDRLIEGQLRSTTREAINSLAQQGMGRSSGLLAFVALLVAAVALLPPVYKALQWLVVQVGVFAAYMVR